MNILIVDDSKEKIAEVKTLLGGLAGTRLDSSSSGLEARERLSHTQYGLLILDIRLPFRDGDEPDRRGGMNLLTEITLSDRFLRPSHVVALTGFDDLRNEFLAEFNNGEWGIERYDRSDIGWRERLRAKAVYIQKVLLQSGYNFKTDLCVIVALDEPELDAVRSLPWQWSEAEALDQVSFLYRGQYSCEGNALSVTAAAAPRMGMVASAILTQKLVHDLRSRMLAMTGICAGVPRACVLGDVLLANPCWDWQMGKYVQETFEIAPDQLSIPLEVTQRFTLLQQDRKLFIGLAEAFKGEKPNHVPRLLAGPVASGSAVLADDATTAIITHQHRKLLGVDMELYGVYSSVRRSSTNDFWPQGCL